jgi:hypothetical protein
MEPHKVEQCNCGEFPDRIQDTEAVRKSISAYGKGCMHVRACVRACLLLLLAPALVAAKVAVGESGARTKVQGHVNAACHCQITSDASGGIHLSIHGSVEWRGGRWQ